MEWLGKEEYAKMTGLSKEAVEDLIERKKLNIKVEDGEVKIDPSSGVGDVVPTTLRTLSENMPSEMVVKQQFVEKTIGTIINLHEKVLDAKDETLQSLKSENEFLKEALASLQELYDEDRKTIEALQQQLKLALDEVEFMKRKYKLMWNKTIEEHSS
ncbi:FIG00469551: hypothetical protein [hydrothermal vent metagenome]|uniref:DUF3972 domain-containing protein n=1 Tax=hydrothermal vent metagenome TaxID=652676 RepID=A0A1W1B8D8_9ZZZZ